MVKTILTIILFVVGLLLMGTATFMVGKNVGGKQLIQQYSIVDNGVPAATTLICSARTMADWDTITSVDELYALPGYTECADEVLKALMPFR